MMVVLVVSDFQLLIGRMDLILSRIVLPRRRFKLDLDLIPQVSPKHNMDHESTIIKDILKNNISVDFDWVGMFDFILSRLLTKPTKCGYAPSEDSDQPGHPPSLIRVFAVRSMGS